MSVVTMEQDQSVKTRELLISLRILSDADANLVLLAHQRGISYRDIAEAWGVAPVIVARRLRTALVRMGEARREASGGL